MCVCVWAEMHPWSCRGAPLVMSITNLITNKEHIALTTIAKSVSAPRADVQTTLKSPKNPKPLTKSTSPASSFSTDSSSCARTHGYAGGGRRAAARRHSDRDPPVGPGLSLGPTDSDALVTLLNGCYKINGLYSDSLLTDSAAATVCDCRCLRLCRGILPCRPTSKCVTK